MKSDERISLLAFEVVSAGFMEAAFINSMHPLVCRDAFACNGRQVQLCICYFWRL